MTWTSTSMLDAAVAEPLHHAPNRMWAQPVPSPTPSGSRPDAWFVIATHSQAERRADENLRRQGYVTYLPLATVRRRDRVIRSLWHTVHVPLFRGYLFVRSDPHWHPMLSTYGVHHLICHADGRPSSVAASVIEALQDTDEARQRPPGPSWRPGEACRLAAGPFTGHDAVVLSVNGDTALVSLLVFGHPRNARVQVDALGSRDE